MTLTSSKETWSPLMNAHWQVLRKRMERKFGSKIQYWRLYTNEGNGVLHIVLTGTYVPQSWLSQNWNDIHQSPIVYIQALFRKRTPKRLASYLAGHYLAGHDYHVYTRQSSSWSWCFRGSVGVWKRVLESSGSLDIAIARFNVVLRTQKPLLFFNTHRKEKRWKEIGSIKPLTRYHGFQPVKHEYL